MDLSMPSHKVKEETATHSSMEEEESASGMDEEDQEEGVESHERPQQTVTGRTVNVLMLLQDGLIESAENCMSIEYRGQKFTGDLSADGHITCHQTKEMFASPSAWAINCKRTINPDRRSGVGWASIKYKGTKLDVFKSAWYRKHHEIRQPETFTARLEEKKEAQEEKAKVVKTEEVDGDGPLNLCVMKAPSPHLIPPEMKPHVSPEQKYTVRRAIKHHTLGRRLPEHDPSTLVECTPFSAMAKLQPFTITITSNSLLLMDFHCHLSTSEVVGYLAGKWDPSTQNLSILQIFPCRCRLGDREKSPYVEEEIRQGIERRGLSLVGWYHSHPHAPASPSLRDVETQMGYQLGLKGAGHTYQPCVGVICSPYNKHSPQKESRIDAYWVMPPPENRVNDYGMPMSMHYDSVQDVFLSQDVLNEMQWLIEFYSNAADKVNFNDKWQHSLTFLDKIKGTLSAKFPKDQTDGRFQDYIQSLLLA